MREKSIDYDAVSKVYDKARTGNPEIVHELLNGSGVSPTSIVLDVGCGTGNNTLLFTRESHASVVGLDLSKGMLEKACEKTCDFDLILSPADTLPFASGSYDFVFMTEVIHLLPEIEFPIKETRRVLNDSGSVCIVTQSHKQIEDRMTSRFFPTTIPIDQARYPDIPELEEILTHVGFQSVWSTTRLLAPVPIGEEYYDTVSRRGYSMLHKISEDDYFDGLKALRTALDTGEKLVYSVGYTFVWGSVTKRH